MEHPSRALLIFAREPVVGKVKTRLAADIGDDRAMELYKCLLQDVMENIHPQQNTEIIVYYACDDGDPEYLKSKFKEYPLKPQAQGDLGERLSEAVKDTINSGFDQICIIGTDCISLSKEICLEAFKALESNEVVLGPCSDGGYYLIGLNEECRELFNGIDWGTDKVFRQTQETAKALKKTIYLLPQLEDVDTLKWLKNTLESTYPLGLSVHTQKFIKKCLPELVFEK